MDGDRLCNAFWSPESKQTEKELGALLLVYWFLMYKRKRGNDREMRGGIERERQGKEKERGRERECEVGGRKEREQLGERIENCTHTHTQNHYMGISGFTWIVEWKFHF